MSSFFRLGEVTESMSMMPTFWWKRAVVVIALLLVLAAEFYRVDSGSHSISDTLINFVPRAFVITFVWSLILFVTKERKVSPVAKEEE